MFNNIKPLKRRFPREHWGLMGTLGRMGDSIGALIALGVLGSGLDNLGIKCSFTNAMFSIKYVSW